MTLRIRPPRAFSKTQPVRLQFGLVEDPKRHHVSITPVTPTPKNDGFPPYEPKDLVGTLTLKKVHFEKTPPLQGERLLRIQKNLKKIYEEGKQINTKSVVDLKDHQTLVIAFAFQQNTVDRMRGIDRNERQWDPEARAWHVFIGCFDDIFDILGYGFQLTQAAYEGLLKFIETPYYAYVAKGKLGKLIVRESWFTDLENLPILPSFVSPTLVAQASAWIQNFTFGRKPYSHQIQGVEFLITRPSSALLDEMGCGKTFQIASALGILFQQKEINRALIVAPKSLVRTWAYELGIALKDLPFTIIGGSPTERKKQLQEKTPIFLLHYEALRLEENALRDWLACGKGIVVFDESQRIKNLQAKTTASAAKVRGLATRCVIATGTPIANRPIDLFAQYYVMDQGATFGTNFSAFKNTFCHMEAIDIPQGRRRIRVEKFIGVKNADELKRRVQATSLRRLKRDVLDLPPLVYKNYSVELHSEQKTLYARLRDEARTEISSLHKEEFAKNIQNIMVRLLRLSQVASNPKLVDPNYKGSNAKFSELDDILQDILSDENKKVILWSHFIENTNFLQQTYEELYGAVCHNGQMSLEERTQSIQAFEDNPKCRLFIATPQSAKEGLTLLPKTAGMMADTMVYLDMNFDAGSYAQSQARFHRIGQNAEKCLVIHLLGENTVDEYIKKNIDEKLTTALKLLDENHVIDDNMNWLKELNQEDLLKVLNT